MFTAILFVCSVYQAEGCYMLVDDRGPYITEKECETRIEEMTLDFTDVLPPTFKVVNQKCKQDTKMGTAT